MSTTAISWAWQQPTRNSGQRLVLLALCDHMADHDDQPGVTAWPSIKRLAAMTGLSGSMVRQHIDALVEDGLVVKLERRRRKSGTLGTWLYQLQMDTSDTSDTSDSAVAVDTTTSDSPPAVSSAGGLAVVQCQSTSALEPLVLNHQSELCVNSTDHLCEFLADAVESSGAKRPTITKSWTDEMDKLQRLDGRTPEQIKSTIRWLSTGTDKVALFWWPMVWHPKKLRQKWDTMAVQYRNQRALQTQPQAGSTMDRVRAANSRMRGN